MYGIYLPLAVDRSRFLPLSYNTHQTNVVFYFLCFNFDVPKVYRIKNLTYENKCISHRDPLNRWSLWS